jgi:hypothetical protein
MYIDFQTLKKDIPIDEALEMFGKDFKRRGSFKCISKEHNDKNPSMSINPKNNTCHCFSCGATFNPLSLAMQELDTDILSAAKYMIDRFKLNRDFYVIEDDKEEEVEENPFPFTIDEIKAFDLKMNYSFVLHDDYDAYAKIMSDVEQDKKDFNLTDEEAHEEQIFYEDMAREHMIRDGHISLNAMYKEDREGLYYVINSAAENKLDRLSGALEQLNDLYKSEEKAYRKIPDKKLRNAVVKVYLKFENDPFSTTKTEDDLLMGDFGKQVLSAYTPLRDTHREIEKLKQEMEEIKKIQDKIPEKYRENSLDSMIDNMIEPEDRYTGEER